LDQIALLKNVTEGYVIRKASESDADAIKDVINSAFCAVEQFFMEGDRVTLAEVEDGLRNGAFLVAESDSGIEGCVYVELRGERAYLGLLSVSPKQQQRGTGSRLVQAAEDYCRKFGCAFMDIKIVNLRTELPDFYGKRGYVETGTSPFPPVVETKLPCHFVDMTKQLR
jgi:N-acetylglutamate synthase-like GNAT family acetyltransferase